MSRIFNIVKDTIKSCLKFIGFMEYSSEDIKRKEKIQHVTGAHINKWGRVGSGLQYCNLGEWRGQILNVSN